MGYNIFLDGNTYRSSRNVESELLVADLSTGIALTWGRYRISYTQVIRTPEFVGQEEPSTFGALALASVSEGQSDPTSRAAEEWGADLLWFGVGKARSASDAVSRKRAYALSTQIMAEEDAIPGGHRRAPGGRWSQHPRIESLLEREWVLIMEGFFTAVQVDEVNSLVRRRYSVHSRKKFGDITVDPLTGRYIGGRM